MRQGEFYKNSYAKDQDFDSLPKLNKIISLIEKELPPSRFCWTLAAERALLLL